MSDEHEDLIEQHELWEYEYSAAGGLMWLSEDDKQTALTHAKRQGSTGRTRHRVVMTIKSLWKITEKDEDDTDKP